MYTIRNKHFIIHNTIIFIKSPTQDFSNLSELLLTRCYYLIRVIERRRTIPITRLHFYQLFF